jgi:hypothetical protein
VRATGISARAIVAAAAVTGLAACSGGVELAPSGKGLPVVTVDFTAAAEPGSVHTSTVHVTNPGPGDISRLAVSFALVGAPSSEGLPHPIVGPGRDRSTGDVVTVQPRPLSLSADGAVYRFDGLAEGGSVTLRFRLRVPEQPGIAANSVTVYDDADPSRARGARLETRVEG